MNKKILAIIGAGEGALPIINAAKKMGVKTVAYGRNDSLAKEQVDFFVEENNFDVHFIAESCKELHVDGIMPSSELSTEVASRVAHEVGLIGNEIENGFGGKNKYYMRTKVSQVSSVKQPLFQLYHEGDELSFPVVVKPVDSCGKRGVCIAYNGTDLREAVDVARNYSTDGAVIIEEYLKGGQEYSIECLSYGKRQHQIIQYTEKESAGPPHFVEIGHHQPANLTDELKTRIDKSAWDILEILGLNCGMAHLELKIIDNEIYFIEVGARGGGDHISDILTPLSTGFDYYKAAIECHLGIYKPCTITNKAYTGIYFHSKQNEKLKPLFEQAKTAEWCVKNTVVKDEFDEVLGNVSATNSGYIIYCADHRIGIMDCDVLEAQLINQYPNAKNLILQHCYDINNILSGERFDAWFQKIINTGNIIAVLNDEKIIAFALLYCNHIDSLDAYLCNVYVLSEYRGRGLSLKLLKMASKICVEKGFKSISLHVDRSNERAINIYEKYGFKPTDTELQDGMITMRMFIN